jgi:septum formation protein
MIPELILKERSIILLKNERVIGIYEKLTFILASESPRRRALLTQAGIPHIAVSSGADESVAGTPTPEEMVTDLANRKVDAALATGGWPRPFVIIAADTVVYLNGQILGKPSCRDDAVRMLGALQGQTHIVYTGVALRYLTQDGTLYKTSFADTARVRMRGLTQTEIERYAATGEPDDKAGAYGIQGLGSTLIAHVDGDYHTVVGLPLARLCSALAEWGVDYTECWL